MKIVYIVNRLEIDGKLQICSSFQGTQYELYNVELYFVLYSISNQLEVFRNASDQDTTKDSMSKTTKGII